MVSSTGEGIVVDLSAAPFEPSEQTRPHIWSYFGLNWTAGLLLNDHRSGSNFGSSDESSNLYFYEVADAQFAVDRQINNARSLMRPSRSRKKRTSPLTPLRGWKAQAVPHLVENCREGAHQPGLLGVWPEEDQGTKGNIGDKRAQNQAALGKPFR